MKRDEEVQDTLEKEDLVVVQGRRGTLKKEVQNGRGGA